MSECACEYPETCGGSGELVCEVCSECEDSCICGCDGAIACGGCADCEGADGEDDEEAEP